MPRGRKLKRLKRPKSESSSSDDDENDDIDERGNIKGLIDYSYDDDAGDDDGPNGNGRKSFLRLASNSSTLCKTSKKKKSGVPKKKAASTGTKNKGKAGGKKKPGSPKQKSSSDKPIKQRKAQRGRGRPSTERKSRKGKRKKNAKKEERDTRDLEILPLEIDGHEHMSPADQTLTKMLILSQLCSQVENLHRPPRRRRRRRSEDTEDPTTELLEDTEDEDYWEDEDDDFESTLTMEEQKYYISLSDKDALWYDLEYRTIRENDKGEIPLKFRILNHSTLSLGSKSFVINRLQQFQTMEPHANEYNKLRSWFSNFNKLPIGKFAEFPLPKKATKTQIYNFLHESRKKLDGAVYGHDSVKNDIIQILAGWISNRNGTGQVLALQGPPGNGKTTLVKKGLAAVLNRPFALIALGGAKDSAFLQGHDYTFEGSKPGRIIEVIRDCGAMNPVIFFDEVDKLSETPGGQEISNLLCHLLDPVQNSDFQDRYFSGIDIDLSKVVWVLSFNDESKIDPIMKDRLRIIRTGGFNTSEKIKIAKNYLVPEILETVKFKQKDLTIPDDVIRKIIESHTEEDGVRELRRCLEEVVNKLNVLKLIGKKSAKKVAQLVDYNIQAKFPLVLTMDQFNVLAKKRGQTNDATSVNHMYL